MADQPSSRPASSGVGPGFGKPVHLDPSAGSTLCRNIVIHGSCKYQDKGCRFYHGGPPNKNGLGGAIGDGAPAVRSMAGLRPDTPTFTPGGGGGGLHSTGPSSVDLPSLAQSNPKAAVFVPRGSTASRACIISVALLVTSY